MVLTDSRTPLLSLQGANKSFGDTQVLHDIDLTLNQGEILFLLGPSGCGKTTLLRLIAGFEMADTGQLQIAGETMFDQQHFVPPRERRLGYVLQEGVLFPHLNVYRNIAYGLGDGKGRAPQDRERIEEVMALTGISELAKRMPHEISGGQQQRVALARALALRPRIMLLDEPFSALDEHLRAQIRDDVTDILRRSNAAAIIVTHDRHEALSHADRIGVMQKGHLVQLDTPRNLFHKPATLDVARFINERSIFLPGRLESDGCCANTSLGARVPVEIVDIDRDTTQSREGQVMVRADQLLPVSASDEGALFEADVQRIAFHGHHSQIDLDAAGTPISLSVGREYEALHEGERIGVKLVGPGLFYPGD